MTLPHWLAGTVAVSALALTASAQAQTSSAFPNSQPPSATYPGTPTAGVGVAGAPSRVPPGASAPAGVGAFNPSTGASPQVNPSTPVVQPGTTPIAGMGSTTTTFSAVNPCLQTGQYAAGGPGANPGGGFAYGGMGAGLPGMTNGFGSANATFAPSNQCLFSQYGAGGSGQNPAAAPAYGGLGAGMPGMNNGFGTPLAVPPTSPVPGM